MKSLQADIKNNEFSPVYLIYGEESYLKKLYKNKMKDAIIPKGDTMNYSYYEGKGISVREVIEMSQTLPFFADRRLILIEDSGFFKEQNQELADYIKEIPMETHMIFIESAIDKRGRLYKAVQAKGRVVEMKAQDGKTLSRWVLGLLASEKKKITQTTMQHLLLKTGSDMENIEKEVEKLICYTMGREVITEEDIDAICTSHTTNKIFEMISAVAQKNQKKALDLYYDLLALKEPPMRILFLIARQFNLLMQVKDLQRLGFDGNTTAKKTGLPPFAVKNHMTQARSFTGEELRAAVEECAALEEDVKTGRISDLMSVEILIIKYSASV